MYLVFDIGGTKMRLAISNDGKTINGKPRIIETPKDFKDGVFVFQKAVQELSGGKKIKAAAGGIAGPLDKEKTMLINSPHIAGWIKKPLKKELQKAINASVYLENDAGVVGLGEAVMGAGKGEDIVAYITISTGIGGVRIVDGKIDKSAFGFEPGHQIIDPREGFYSTRYKFGYLEPYISGAALEKRYHKKPYEITDDKIWEEEAKWLAHGLNNTIVHWSPNIVVLGGSMIVKKPGISIKRVRYHLKKILYIFPKSPRIVQGVLGDIGGLYGALIFLKQNL